MLRKIIPLRVNAVSESFNKSLIIKNKPKLLEACSSKEIRLSIAGIKPIEDFKIGIKPTPAETLNWCYKIGKLSSTKHKSLILRIAHGEIYTKEKLHRFNLIDSNICPRCDEIETLNHKFINCDYVRRIWSSASRFQLGLLGSTPNTQNEIALALGCFNNSTQAYLTLAVEILQRISYLKDNQQYLIHPTQLVKQCIRSIQIKERDKNLKDILGAHSTWESYTEMLRIFKFYQF